MAILNEAQTAVAVRAMQEFLSSPTRPSTGKTMVEEDAILDKNRRDLIADQLAPAVKAFLAESLSLPIFKTEIDRLNKKSELWCCHF